MSPRTRAEALNAHVPSPSLRSALSLCIANCGRSKHRVFGLNEARVDLLARKLRGEPRSGGPRSDRLEFINGLQSVPMDAQAFDDKFSKTVALELSKTLTYMPV